MKTTIEVLRDARALIERGWTQGAAARDAIGNRTGAKVPWAVCWCSVGAISAVTNGVREADLACDAVDEVLGIDALTTWNDTPGRTQAEVLAAFDRAIGDPVKFAAPAPETEAR